MADVVTPAVRSRMMSSIKAKDTKPEVKLRSCLHKLGFRFRKNVKDLPGKPDIVLPKYKAVIFVNGCFWHRHNCDLFRLPSSNTEFWDEKLAKNRTRDLKKHALLSKIGFRVCIVWECAFRGKNSRTLHEISLDCKEWLLEGKSDIEIYRP